MNPRVNEKRIDEMAQEYGGYQILLNSFNNLQIKMMDNLVNATEEEKQLHLGLILGINYCMDKLKQNV